MIRFLDPRPSGPPKVFVEFDASRAVDLTPSAADLQEQAAFMSECARRLPNGSHIEPNLHKLLMQYESAVLYRQARRLLGIEE